jgi:pyruvate dehydrogenase E1 component alpha subunit
VSEIRQKAEGYGMPNARVDGMDVLAVRQAADEALAQVRSVGPFLLEAITYRFRGHSLGDPERYRGSDEVRRWQEDDPIGIFRRIILERGAHDEAALDAEERQVEQEVQEAVAFAEQSPSPGPELLFGTEFIDGVR